MFINHRKMEEAVRRRICMMGAVISAVPLTLGVAPAMAASSSAKKQKPKPLETNCTTNVGIMIASGDTGLTPPIANGHEYGTATCGKVLGHGVQTDTFTTPDSGDTLATFTLYFPGGTVHGTYDLTPQEGGLNFLETDYLGTLKVKGGSGLYHGVKGTGTSTCQSLDGIHTTCHDKLKLAQL
jgi:hypothetical protein